MTFSITQLYIYMNNVIRRRTNKLHIHKIGFPVKKYQCPLNIHRKHHIHKQNKNVIFCFTGKKF